MDPFISVFICISIWSKPYHPLLMLRSLSNVSVVDLFGISLSKVSLYVVFPDLFYLSLMYIYMEQAVSSTADAQVSSYVSFIDLFYMSLLYIYMEEQAISSTADAQVSKISGRFRTLQDFRFLIGLFYMALSTCVGLFTHLS